MSSFRGILLDIEGTTTPIAFVHDVLFSYARIHAKEFLAKNFESDQVRADVALLREDDSKTTVIWLYQNQEGDDEAAEETPQPGPAF